MPETIKPLFDSDPEGPESEFQRILWEMDHGLSFWPSNETALPESRVVEPQIELYDPEQSENLYNELPVRAQRQEAYRTLGKRWQALLTAPWKTLRTRPHFPQTGKEPVRLTAYMQEQYGGFLDLRRAIPRPERPAYPQVRGFEVLGLDNKLLMELWSERFYPHGLIEGQISVINFLPTQEIMGDHYGPILALRPRAAEADIGVNSINFFFNDQIKLKLDKQNQKSLLEMLDLFFGHELSHFHDWCTTPDLNTYERSEFLREVTEAFRRPRSYRDPGHYVQNLQNNDPSQEAYFKVMEWWATIGSSFFSTPVELRKIDRTAYNLIEKMMLRKDPKFNINKSLQAKAEFKRQILGSSS